MSKVRSSPSRAKSPKNNLGPIVLIGAGIIIVFAVVILQLAQMTSAAPEAPAVNLNLPYPNIERVSLRKAYEAHQSSNAVFLDVRDAGTFGSKHIAGSINIPLTELESRLSELPQDRWIITVCT